MRPEELISRRKSMDLTQAELAEKLGTAANTVARWERGERAIPPYLKWALDGIEGDLMHLSPEQGYQRNRAIIERHDKEASERWADMTPEERATIQRWFGSH